MTTDAIECVTGLSPEDAANLLVTYKGDVSAALDAHYADATAAAATTAAAAAAPPPAVAPVASSGAGAVSAAERVALVTGLSVAEAAALVALYGDENWAIDAHFSGASGGAADEAAGDSVAAAATLRLPSAVSAGPGAVAGAVAVARCGAAFNKNDLLGGSSGGGAGDGASDGASGGGGGSGGGGDPFASLPEAGASPRLARQVTHSGWPRRPPHDDLRELEKLERWVSRRSGHELACGALPRPGATGASSNARFTSHRIASSLKSIFLSCPLPPLRLEFDACVLSSSIPVSHPYHACVTPASHPCHTRVPPRCQRGALISVRAHCRAAHAKSLDALVARAVGLGHSEDGTTIPFSSTCGRHAGHWHCFASQVTGPPRSGARKK